MNSYEKQIRNESERIMLSNVGINDYVNREHDVMNQGHVNKIKSNENVRILALNSRGLDPRNDQKMNIFVNSCKQHQIDIALLNETNAKWTPASLDQMEYKCKEIGRETWIKGADSKEWEVTNNTYLPGGVMTMITGKCRVLTKEKNVECGPLGN